MIGELENIEHEIYMLKFKLKVMEERKEELVKLIKESKEQNERR